MLIERIYLIQKEKKRERERARQRGKKAIDFQIKCSSSSSESMGDEGFVKLVQIVQPKKKQTKNKSQCVIKDWQLAQKKRWNCQRNTTPSLSPSISPSHTYAHSLCGLGWQ